MQYGTQLLGIQVLILWISVDHVTNSPTHELKENRRCQLAVVVVPQR